MKWALLAVSGYFLLKWYQEQQAASSATTTTTTPATGDTTTATTGVATTAATTTATTTTTTATTTAGGGITRPYAALSNEDVAAKAATGSDAEAIVESNYRGLTLNHHEWNYYRALTLGTQPDPESWAPGSTSDRVSVSTYLAARASAGMGGLGLITRVVSPHLRWLM